MTTNTLFWDDQIAKGKLSRADPKINGIETNARHLWVMDNLDDTADQPLGKFFTWGEYACKGCNGKSNTDGRTCTQYAHRALFEGLDQIREAIGQPIIITSGYRCFGHNAKVGGALRSQHLIGRGADITIKEPDTPAGQITLDEIVGKAKLLGFSGIKRYSRWVHVDVREGPKWWIE